MNVICRSPTLLKTKSRAFIFNKKNKIRLYIKKKLIFVSNKHSKQSML